MLIQGDAVINIVCSPYQVHLNALDHPSPIFLVPLVGAAITMVYEISCFLLTLIKTLGVHRDLGNMGHKRSLTMLLLENGE